MKRIFIWGAGRYSKTVYESLDKNRCIIVGFIDNNCMKQGKLWENEIPINSPGILVKDEFDYIFISVKNYEPIQKQCLQLGISENKIISFWKFETDIPFTDTEKIRFAKLEDKICKLENELKRCIWRIENQPYELELKYNIPFNIVPSESLLREILIKRASLCRFGDGEFEIIRGNERAWFQKTNKNLAIRLKEILESNEKNVLIAIANNFGNLASYTDDAADSIREYLSGSTREDIMKLLHARHTYYDAYVSRPYMIYRDKNHAKKIFELFKKIWKGRRLLIIEGNSTKTGVGNDLLYGSDSIRRILCPDINAFDYYAEIIKCIYKNIQNNDLVLISLGPAATVLAFDLAKQGIQALDIGQLDNEYEWFLRGATQRIEIPGKGVSELGWCRGSKNLKEIPIYSRQIIDKIISQDNK